MAKSSDKVLLFLLVVIIAVSAYYFFVWVEERVEADVAAFAGVQDRLYAAEEVDDTTISVHSFHGVLRYMRDNRLSFVVAGPDGVLRPLIVDWER